MKLYWSDVLSPRKACAVAKYLQSPVEYAYLDLGRGEHKTTDYLALNPNGKVPTLVDGSLVLWEADAIMCHLAARSDSELWPQDGRQIEVIRWLSWNTQHFTRHGGTLYFEYIIRARFGMGIPDPNEVEQATKEWRRFAKVLDQHLRDRRWLVGDTLTVADFAVAVTLPYAERAHIPLAEFPAIERWHERLNELDAWREPFPELVAAD
ncbi:glutathione S-transferase family protein [Rhodanobacter glycinis]|uniref:Glutathione S-transferase n=1 Tax=Rhodanobacter glycinis TaxID=582702 RepID=A0A1I4BZZ8_9GAMM|nr:glutathione S-transferase family protein [Rhodanobacter glycinis]SFK74073.1 glutathione S-transferase [Rhodanobacter glycinis]